jgi:hypothetical protein
VRRRPRLSLPRGCGRRSRAISRLRRTTTGRRSSSTRATSSRITISAPSTISRGTMHRRCRSTGQPWLSTPTSLPIYSISPSTRLVPIRRAPSSCTARQYPYSRVGLQLGSTSASFCRARAKGMRPGWIGQRRSRSTRPRRRASPPLCLPRRRQAPEPHHRLARCGCAGDRFGPEASRGGLISRLQSGEQVGPLMENFRPIRAEISSDLTPRNGST